MYRQTVKLEHGTSVELEVFALDRAVIIPTFARRTIELFGVEVEISSLPFELVEAIYDEAVTHADDMEWAR